MTEAQRVAFAALENASSNSTLHRQRTVLPLPQQAMAANTSIKSFGTHPADASAQRREASVLEQRRRIEQDRLSRLLDPKQRTIGVDKLTLDEQVADRARQKEIEAMREASFAQSAIAVDHQLQLIDRETARQRKQLSVDESQYRHEFQQKSQRKEWDLSNPSALKSEGPARQSDTDPALHVSGLQKLQGEDLSNPVRFKKQQQQMRDWIKVQLEEKQRRIEAERATDQHFASYGAEISGISGDIEAENIRARKEHNLSVKEFNIAMAEERRRREHVQKEADTRDAFEEINNVRTSRRRAVLRFSCVLPCVPPHFCLYFRCHTADPALAEPDQPVPERRPRHYSEPRQPQPQHQVPLQGHFP